MSIRQAEDPTTANRIASVLARRIVEAEIAPGSRLREVPLAAEFGVSRGSVREALRILERDGVVRIEAHRGAQVTLLSTDELIEIFQVRTALLGLAMALFCERCEASDHVWFKEQIGRLKKAGRDTDSKAASLHADISAEMAGYALRRGGNLRLERMFMQMSAQVARYTRLGLSAKERRRQSIDTWQQLSEALRRRDPSAAERCGRTLVTNTFRFALGQIAGIRPDL